MEQLDIEKAILALGLEFQSITDGASVYKHPSGTGDTREDAVRSFMAKVLPERFRVDRGKIIDSHGRLSSEFDVIISERQEIMPGLEYADRMLIPIESVYGVIEVKSHLSSYRPPGELFRESFE